MDIAWLRDLALIIFAFVASAVLILLAVLVLYYYRRIGRIVNSASNISKSLERVTARVEDDVLKPIIELLAFYNVLVKIIEGVKKFFMSKKGEKDESGE